MRRIKDRDATRDASSVTSASRSTLLNFDEKWQRLEDLHVCETGVNDHVTRPCSSGTERERQGEGERERGKREERGREGEGESERVRE